MTTPTNHRPVPLTDKEEVTLRHVAFGQSEVKAMRAHDLARLRRLGLIEDGRDGPRLTAAGRTVFDRLPKPVEQERPEGSDDMLQHMERLLSDTRRR